jgi:hypothetical protein
MAAANRFVSLSSLYTRLENFDQVYGLSGAGNIFKPGTLTGTARASSPSKTVRKPTRMTGIICSDSRSGLSPDFGEKGFLKTLFGAGGKSVFRGGYSFHLSAKDLISWKVF